MPTKRTEPGLLQLMACHPVMVHVVQRPTRPGMPARAAHGGKRSLLSRARREICRKVGRP